MANNKSCPKNSSSKQKSICNVAETQPRFQIVVKHTLIFKMVFVHDNRSATFACKFFEIYWFMKNLGWALFLVVFVPLIAKGNSTNLSSLVEPVERVPQTSDTLKIDFSANFQSRHIWRGTLTCDAWNVQPTVNFSNKNFLVGAWGAYTVNNSYAEIDLYIAYSVGNFTIALLDYFCPNENQRFNRLFDFNKLTTQHTFDLTLSFEGTRKFPIKFMASTLLWGDDINPTTGNNYFSTYLETGFYWERNSSQKFDFFVGATPFKGYYAKSFNIVSLGASINQYISVSDDLTIPIFGKLIVNPYTENIFLVFGLTLRVN